MANHRQIISGCESESEHFFETVFVKDRAHIQVVRHDEAAKFHVLPKKISDHP